MHLFDSFASYPDTHLSIHPLSSPPPLNFNSQANFDIHTTAHCAPPEVFQSEEATRPVFNQPTFTIPPTFGYDNQDRAISSKKRRKRRRRKPGRSSLQMLLCRYYCGYIVAESRTTIANGLLREPRVFMLSFLEKAILHWTSKRNGERAEKNQTKGKFFVFSTVHCWP